ncbi:uncharacterized protein LOC113852234 [Abrus precatorius]|uniref:Uncharacterized protein LOC113852234 n=1 Tax=Abrus precatorius TaxID=3816 RepID=A0A8B8K598_ABRPR|nr:uncharacterized protein LOC113852234 [Abrus precatorius]
MTITCPRWFLTNRSGTYRVNIDEDTFIVTVTAAGTVARRWLNETMNINQVSVNNRTAVVGLGVQWSPSGAQAADTVQLCVGQRCLIFQISRAEFVPSELRHFLWNRGFTFVGFWNRHDRAMLSQSRHALQLRSDPLDLVRLVRNEVAGAPLERIVEEYLGFTGVRLTRNVTMSDWNRPLLTFAQIFQVAAEARCAYLIGNLLQAWQFRYIH